MIFKKDNKILQVKIFSLTNYDGYCYLLVKTWATSLTLENFKTIFWLCLNYEYVIFWSKMTHNVLKRMNNQFADIFYLFTIFKCFTNQNWKKKKLTQKMRNVQKRIFVFVSFFLYDF